MFRAVLGVGDPAVRAPVVMGEEIRRLADIARGGKCSREK